MTARIPTHRLSPAAGTTSSAAGDDDAWAGAACLKEDPELFWPVGEATFEDRMQIAAAKAVCRACPVLDRCRREALDKRIEDGIWGGLTESERRAMKPARATRAATPKPAPAAKSTAPVKRDPITRPTCGRERGYTEHTNRGERQCDTCRAWRARGKRVEEAA